MRALVAGLLSAASFLLLGCTTSLPPPAAAATIPAEAPKIVFVCEHGAAKSVLAAALFDRATEQRGLRLRAEHRASGTPQREPSVATTKGLMADHLPAPSSEPLRVSERDVRDAKLVVTFGTALPVSGGEGKLEDWADVPAVGEGYAAARDAMQKHIDQLLDQLGHGQR